MREYVALLFVLVVRGRDCMWTNDAQADICMFQHVLNPTIHAGLNPGLRALSRSVVGSS